MVTAPPKPQEVDPAKVAGMAAKVAEHLQTHYQDKKQGGYSIYQDERLSIFLDTYVPNISVCLFFPEGDRGVKATSLVFTAAHHSWGRPEVYKPGQWIGYLQQLAERAEEVKREREGARVERERQDHDRRSAPLDDAAFFGQALERD